MADRPTDDDGRTDAISLLNRFLTDFPGNFEEYACFTVTPSECQYFYRLSDFLEKSIYHMRVDMYIQ